MNQKNIVVLGAGRVGSAIAVDLSKEFDVTVTDINQEVLNKLGDESSVKAIRVDLSTAGAIREMVKDFDLVIGSVPGYMGYNTVKNVIQSGKNMVDISFFPQNPFDLNELAKKAGITVVIDCGVAPGMGNIILGYHNRKMQINRFECLVGGLPVVREWPYEYKAVFSPVDVIEEYIRPARYVENSTIVVREALSDPELVYFEGLGTLESWNSDGLRTLIKTMGIPNMKEKTLRYPGTIEYLRVLRETGFFSSETVYINGKEIRPVDLTARLLFKKWKLNPGEEDFTVMRITIEGEENGKPKTFIYDLYDRYDQQTNTLSMAKTTGYTCAAVAKLLLDGKFHRTGICPPEYVGEDEDNFQFILNYQKERGVHYKVSERI